MDYGDYIETRVRDLIRQDRSRRGITSVFSAEADALRGRIRREWAWLEIGALVATGLFFVVGILVG